MSLRVFGEIDGVPVHEVTLRSAGGAVAKVIGWGATLRDLHVPGGLGASQRVVLGFHDLDSYRRYSPHFGAVPGRVANRIAGGRFSLDGKTYDLARKPGDSFTIHGGPTGFGKSIWRVVRHDERSVVLAIVSPDGDNGFPGNLTATCRYSLEEPATLRVEFTAVTDAPTPVNLCQHSYFNLDGSDTVLDHTLVLDADFITPQDGDGIPSGEVRDVAGTPYDFRKERALREQDGAFHYDNNFVLTRRKGKAAGIAGKSLHHAGTLRSARSNLALATWTTEPALQLYDGWKVKTPVPGLEGKPYGANAGVCLETQHYPDSPSHPHFPCIILRPGEVYRHVTEYRFS